MNKIQILKMLVKNPIAILKAGISTQWENYYKTEVQSKYNIQQLPTISIMELFPDFSEKLNVYSFLSGTSFIMDIMLLKSFARTFNQCSYLEIGSWRGESIANVADVAEDCISVTLSEEQMRSLNFGEEFIRVHALFSKEKKNITTIGENSFTFNFESLNKKFDLIFVDGDHSYAGVLNDTKKVFPLMKNRNSIIVWHDYGFNEEDVRPSVLNGILDGIPKEKHKNLFHVSNTVCAVYIEGRKSKTGYTKFPSYPDKKFSVEVTAENFSDLYP